MSWNGQNKMTCVGDEGNCGLKNPQRDFTLYAIGNAAV